MTTEHPQQEELAAGGEAATTSGACCSCGTGEEPPARAGEPEPSAAAKRHAGGCGGMAELFTTSRPSGAMAACREMFESTAADSSTKED